MSSSAMTRIDSILSDAFHRGAALGRFTKIITLGIVVTLVIVLSLEGHKPQSGIPGDFDEL